MRVPCIAPNLVRPWHVGVGGQLDRLLAAILQMYGGPADNHQRSSDSLSAVILQIVLPVEASLKTTSAMNALRFCGYIAQRCRDIEEKSSGTIAHLAIALARVVAGYPPPRPGLHAVRFLEHGGSKASADNDG